MKLTAKEENFAVVDDVFSEEIFQAYWEYFNGLDFAYRSMTGWQKVWRINDGLILAGMPYYHSAAPFNCKMDWLHQTVIQLAKDHFSDIVGKEGEDWKEVLFTPYLYPANTKISWHDDNGYTGACIFYPHREWSAHWGGELLVAKTPPENQVQQKSPGDLLTRKHHSDLLSHYGMGVYLSPNPNRMVFTRGSVWHAINRVDPAAGDNVRCSVVVFFMKK